jgi:hypothetical protein
MVDYILLILLALEYLYFGLLGLIDPASTSALVAFTLNETIAFSEFRALYSFFTFIGLLSVIAIFEKNLRLNTYFVIALLNGSFVFGRVVSILHDGMPDQLLWTIFVVDFTVFILAAWRYNALR